MFFFLRLRFKGGLLFGGEDGLRDLEPEGEGGLRRGLEGLLLLDLEGSGGVLGLLAFVLGLECLELFELELSSLLSSELELVSSSSSSSSRPERLGVPSDSLLRMVTLKFSKFFLFEELDEDEGLFSIVGLSGLLFELDEGCGCSSLRRQVSLS